MSRSRIQGPCAIRRKQLPRNFRAELGPGVVLPRIVYLCDHRSKGLVPMRALKLPEVLPQPDPGS